MKVNVCVICLKPQDETWNDTAAAAGGEDSCDPPLLNKFLKFAQNYLDISSTATHQLLLNRRGDGLGHEGEAFCEKCELTLIIPICQLYTQLLSTQQRLSWELDQLAELLHKSQPSVPNDQDSHNFAYLQEFRSLLTQKYQLKRKETLPSIGVEHLNTQLIATEPYSAPAANQPGESMEEVEYCAKLHEEQEGQSANEDVKIEMDFWHDDDDDDRDDDNSDVDPLSFDPADSFHSFKSEPGFLDTTLDDDVPHKFTSIKNEDVDDDNTPTFPPNSFSEPLLYCSHQNPTPGVSYVQPKSCEHSIFPDSLEIQGHINQEQQTSTPTSRHIGRTTHIRKTNPGMLPPARIPSSICVTTLSESNPVVSEFDCHQDKKQRGNLKLRPDGTYSYTQMIVQALASTPDHQLTAKEICSYITKRYPNYRIEDRQWQNCVCSNLSRYPRYFLKVPRPQEEPGLGSFWRICPQFESNLIKQAFWERMPDSHALFVPSRNSAASPTHTGAIAAVISENFHPEIEAAHLEPSSFVPPPIPPTKKRRLLPKILQR